MSGIELLLKTSVDYERTHQLTLYTLLKEANLFTFLFDLHGDAEIVWEPEDQLFDLAVITKKRKIYIEIKMWSSLSNSQLNRQSSFLEKSNNIGAYILLGTSWFEYQSSIDLPGIKIGYKEIITGINKIITTTTYSSDIHELSLAYRNTLNNQFSFLINAFKTMVNKNKIFYYSLYAYIQNNLNNIKTRIYTVNNAGGSVFILNNDDAWINVVVNRIKVDLYFEVESDYLLIKLHPNTDNNEIKLKIRDKIRRAVHKVFDNDYRIIDSGRLGKYMSACYIDHNFSDLNNIDKSISIFSDVHNKFNKIKKELGNK